MPPSTLHDLPERDHWLLLLDALWFESLLENDLCLMSCDALAQPEPSKPTELTWFVVLVIHLFIPSFFHSFIFTLVFFLLFSSDTLFLVPPPHIHAILFSHLLFPIFLLVFLALDLPSPPPPPLTPPPTRLPTCSLLSSPMSPASPPPGGCPGTGDL